MKIHLSDYCIAMQQRRDGQPPTESIRCAGYYTHRIQLHTAGFNSVSATSQAECAGDGPDEKAAYAELQFPQP
jgi:hypothetical protein